MSTGKGINVSRRITAPASTGVQAEIGSLRTGGTPGTFLRAVVVRYLHDPKQLTPEDLKEIEELVLNPSYLLSAPRNSVVIRVVTGNQDNRGGEPIVAYPFLPSHMCFPAKAGEQVWIAYENPGAGGSLPYWLWKTSEPDHVEDANYTHADRKFVSKIVRSTLDKTNEPDSKVPGFPNGAGTKNSKTLSDEKGYENIVNSDPSFSSFSAESVPRFTKRPGDLVIQGSNNSLIVLTDDREGPVQSENTKDKSGTIDAVVGRGRFPKGPGEVPENTQQPTVENTRGYVETDKNTAESGNTPNPNEGDPNYISDASRVYLSMKTDVDGRFPYEIADGIGSTIDEKVDTAAAVMKSDEVRIIARKDDENNINGSIRIIKEGTSGEDRAAIYLLHDGAVQIDAEVIYMGRPGGSGPGPKGTEPYIKFSEYKDQMNELIDITTDLYTTLITQFGLPVAAPGTPAPGLVGSIPSLTQKIAKLNALSARLDQAQSKKIFGE